MPGLNVEGRIVEEMYRSQERIPQLNVCALDLLGRCNPPSLALNPQRRDDLNRLYHLLHIRNNDRVGKKRASRRGGQLALVHPQGEKRQSLAAQMLLHCFAAINSRQEPIAFLHLLQ